MTKQSRGHPWHTPLLALLNGGSLFFADSQDRLLRLRVVRLDGEVIGGECDIERIPAKKIASIRSKEPVPMPDVWRPPGLSTDFPESWQNMPLCQRHSLLFYSRFLSISTKVASWVRHMASEVLGQTSDLRRLSSPYRKKIASCRRKSVEKATSSRQTGHVDLPVAGGLDSLGDLEGGATDIAMERNGSRVLALIADVVAGPGDDVATRADCSQVVEHAFATAARLAVLVVRHKQLIARLCLSDGPVGAAVDVPDMICGSVEQYTLVKRNGSCGIRAAGIEARVNGGCAEHAGKGGAQEEEGGDEEGLGWEHDDVAVGMVLSVEDM